MSASPYDLRIAPLADSAATESEQVLRGDRGDSREICSRQVGQSGMTLIEVLLALALFAMLGLFVSGVLNSVVGLWQNGERRGRGELVFASGLERFRTDLKAMHNGPRGWLILDQWEARPAKDGGLPLFLPRLRFLADGKSLPLDDPTGRGAVEIAWMLVPETPQGSPLSYLVRMTQPENPQASFQQDRIVENLARQGYGLRVMDGVAWGRLEALDTDGVRKDRIRIPDDEPFDFPSLVYLDLERLEGNPRSRPPILDGPIGGATAQVALRGTAPLKMPAYALIEEEWIRVEGRFPRINLLERGSRNTQIEDHEGRTPVFLPSSYSGQAWVSAGGRRLIP